MTRIAAAQKDFRRIAYRLVDRHAATVWYGKKQEQRGGRTQARTRGPIRKGGEMADKGNDPVAMWQNMIGEMEKGFNSFANQTMSSPEFSKVMNQVGGVAAGAQKQLGELMEKYLVSMNLPSRAQMVGMAERLQSIEGQLNEIKAILTQMSKASGVPAGGSGTPMPPRTKRPPSAEGEPK
jgi:DNA-binding FrmR family transcriptional regulator